MLSEIGRDVARTASAAEGLGAFEQQAPDIVLSDMVMPGEMDGLDLARRLRQRMPNVPVVLMTGFSDAAGAAADEGFTVLRKPFKTESLASSLASALHVAG